MEHLFEYEKVYHVYNRANGKENLFITDDNFRYFLKKYAEYIFPVADTLAYCLMPNHFHLLIKIRSSQNLLNYHQFLKKERKQKPKVVDENGMFDYHKFVMLQFQHFLNGYSQAYNKRYQRKGALFLKNLKLKPVENEAYYSKLVHYIHYNPVHHGFCKKASDWTFSSFHAFLHHKRSKIAKQEVLNWFGGIDGFLDFHKNKPEIGFEYL